MSLAFSQSNSAITVFLDGQRYVIKDTDPGFGLIAESFRRPALDIEELRDLLDPRRLISRWSQGAFKVDDQGRVCDDRGPIPEVLSQRVVALVAERRSPKSLLNFWERVSRNPSKRSVDQLFSFLEHTGIPLDEEGYFLAYKSVRSNFLDHHSGTWENRPGKTLSMPRNEISDDPRTACHEGFHVGALSYAETFGPRDRLIVVCRVDPADVVCVPYDESARKMRVCRYSVVGIHNGQSLPSTVIETSEVPQIPEEQKVEVSSLEEERAAQAQPAPAAPRVTAEELLAMSLADLRRLATDLHIVGASKIPGGRMALIEVLLSNPRGLGA